MSEENMKVAFDDEAALVPADSNLPAAQNAHHLDLESQSLRDIVLNAAVCSEEVMNDAIEEHLRTGRSLYDVVLDYGFIAEQDLNELIAQSLGTDLIELSALSLDPEVLAMVDGETAHMLGIVPVSFDGTTLYVAARNPFNYQIADELRFLVKHDVSVLVAPVKQIDDALEKHYQVSLESAQALLTTVGFDETEDVKDLEQAANDAPIVRFVDAIMYQAIKEVAPDPDNIIIGAWFISHPHSDHQRGFTEFVANHADDPEFTIERIVANYINKEMYQYTRPDGAKESNAALVDELRRIAKEEYPEAQFIKAHTGQVYNFGSSSVEVLYTVEDYLPAEMFNYVNSASLVIRVTVDNTSVMLLADTTHASGKIMEEMFGTHLKSDMVQLAHHGMAPSNASLYKFIQADVLLWPSTYNHAGSRYGQYASVINVALEHAEDVYVSDVALTTLKLPYVIQNNKDAEMSKLGK